MEYVTRLQDAASSHRDQMSKATIHTIEVATRQALADEAFRQTMVEVLLTTLRDEDLHAELTACLRSIMIEVLQDKDVHKALLKGSAKGLASSLKDTFRGHHKKDEAGGNADNKS